MVDIPYKAMLSLVIGQKTQAHEILADYVAAKPENIMAWLCLAIASPHAEALKILQTVLEIDPTNPIALRNLERLQQDPTFELDLETFWAKDDLARPRLSLYAPPTRRVLVSAAPQTVKKGLLASETGGPNSTSPSQLAEAELAEFGQELPTMQLEEDLAKFGEQVPTMPAAFRWLIEMVKTSPQPPVAAPSASLINRQQEQNLASWLGLRSPDPAALVGTTMRLADLTALADAALPFDPTAFELESAWQQSDSPANATSSTLIIGLEAEILERYRPQLEPLTRTARPGSSVNAVFSSFTAISLVIAVLLIGLVIYAVLVANSAVLH